MPGVRSIAIARLNGVEVELHQLIEHLLVGLLGDGREAFAMRAPEAVHDERGSEHASCHERVDRSKLAALDSARDDRRR